MQIGICGAGWLGMPLALSFKTRGHRVFATKRDKSAAQELTQFGVQGCQFSLGDSLTSAALDTLFSGDLFILNIAPGRSTLDAAQFIQNMQALIQQLKRKGTQKLIFISTTSVYGDVQGVINEDSLPTPQTESAKAHVAIENYIRDLFRQDAAILRLAGLVGEDRHPIRSLAGKQSLKNPQAPVNLIHRRDVINAIQAIVTQQHFGHILHLSANQHPTRQDYYKWCAENLRLPLPRFAEQGSSTGKLVDATKSIAALGINLAFPSPYDMLQGLVLKS